MRFAPSKVSESLDEIFRQEAGACTATLIRILGDIDLAEDAVAEAFVIAADRWATDGIPANPGGWITTTARNRAIDHLRRESTRIDRHVAALRLQDPDMEPDQYPELDVLIDVVPDDQLRLMFMCCHPALSPSAQVALTLRLLGGLGTHEIARGFLVPESTMAQRIVRAKRKLRDNRAAYRIPRASELSDRLDLVLHVISLIFTEGHKATSGDDLVRIQLTDEATRLARILVGLMPDEPEAAGLLALFLLTDARRPARVGAGGTMIRLTDQDRSLWDRGKILEGHELVRRCLRRNRPGPFQIQAAIAAVHGDALSADDTDWAQIVALYDQLRLFQDNPVVALNRAAAIGHLHGPESGLAELADIDSDLVADYQPYHAVRADLLASAGMTIRGLEAYDRAIHLTENEPERRFLLEQRHKLSLEDT